MLIHRVREHTYLQISPRACGEPLFHLSDLQQPVPLHYSTEFTNDSDVLANISAKSPEFRVLFDEAFHVADGVYVRGALGERLRLVLLDVGSEGLAEVTECGEVILLEERIGGRRQCDFLRTNSWLVTILRSDK